MPVAALLLECRAALKAPIMIVRKSNKPMIPVSVNFAGTTLRQDNLIEEMEKLIDRYRVRCEYLEVEVSESYADMNQEMLAETSSKIRKANVRVILDHFGSKNSSFSILSLMEFDGLKLESSGDCPAPICAGSCRPPQKHTDPDNGTVMSLPED